MPLYFFWKSSTVFSRVAWSPIFIAHLIFSIPEEMADWKSHPISV